MDLNQFYDIKTISRIRTILRYIKLREPKHLGGNRKSLQNLLQLGLRTIEKQDHQDSRKYFHKVAYIS